ncbi:diaminopimelate decarboxylase [Sinorhizobium meliloti]|uniref:diaminopimelate decarboxylase family protein n=1 Tax=Rhizobium meliloti TaxID=382 RepID=UPI002380B191|nr:diaminopimelate decarboxylase [Sinorhizobium meliloti]MDE3775446.1 diaminopimelate decarboxylase [Sinorhizobium meliloti]
MKSRLTCNETLALTAEKTGTPAYIYDLSVLRGQLAGFRNAFEVPRFSLLFATMANPSTQILKLLAIEQAGACVNSNLHLDLALDAGIPTDKVQFTASGLSVDQMRRLISVGISVNLDSRRQVSQWLALGGGPFGVRLNAGALTEKPGDRLGFDQAEFDALRNEVSADLLAGLHVYVGTNFLDPRDMFPTLRCFFRLAAGLPQLRYVNIGGGVGVDYNNIGLGFDINAFGSEVSQLHRQLPPDTMLFFEPGRALAASSGVFLSRVTDIKRLQGTTFVACDASIAVFPRPLYHPESLHRVRSLRDAGDQTDVVVVGRTTFSRDILARCKLPRGVEVGDLLAFENAGAYCNSMASHFLGQPTPADFYFPIE